MKKRVKPAKSGKETSIEKGRKILVSIFVYLFIGEMLILILAPPSGNYPNALANYFYLMFSAIQRQGLGKNDTCVYVRNKHYTRSI